MTRNVRQHLESLRQQDANVQYEYDRLAPRYQIVSALIEARERAGLTQAELATRMGVSRSTVVRLESLEHTPRLETLERACEVLGCRLDVRLLPGNARKSAA